MTEHLRKPCFTVRVRSAGCRFEVRLNDLPVITHETGCTLAVEAPVNPSVFTGENTLAAMVFPAGPDDEEFAPEARLSLAVRVREIDDPPESGETLGGVEFSGAEPEAEGAGEYIADDMVLLATKLVLETPFPPWGWMTAQRLPATAVVLPLVGRELGKFHRSLEAGDRSAVVALTRRKAREIGIAFHGDEHEGHRLIEYLDHMRDPEMDLLPMTRAGLDLEVYAGGRVVRPVTPTGAAPIVFRVAGHDLAAHMSTLYCLDRQGRWLQIR